MTSHLAKCFPALTTVRQPIYEMGKISRNHTQAIDKDDYIPVKLFQNQVIVRESKKEIKT